MKKILVLMVAFTLLFTALAFAGGDQVCGDKAAGPAGSTGNGNTDQNRAAAD